MKGVIALPSAPMNKQEQQWRAESDARTLMDAKVITKDKKRNKAAIAAAKRMAAEKLQEAQSMRAVANKRV